MKKLLTVKQAIKLRCKDCSNGKISRCVDEDCFLFGMTLANKKGRRKALKDYCRWCRNGLSMKVCTSKTCSIFLYLNKTKVSEDAIHPKKKEASCKKKAQRKAAQ